MQTNKVSARNIGCLIILMELTSLLAGAGKLAQDTWLAVLAAAVIAIPLFLMYARTAKLNLGRGLFDMLDFHFGKVGGGILIALLSWYAIHVSSLVTRNFTEFVSSISLNNTPKIIIMIGMIAVGGYLASCSYKVMGRWALIILSIITFNFILSFFLAFRSMDLNHIKPVFEYSLEEILAAGYKLGSIAFTETFLALIMFQALKPQESPYKPYLIALLFGTVFLAGVMFQNVLVLGKNMVDTSIFPTYITARVIQPGAFIEHIESLLSFALILLGISKASITLRVATVGVEKLFGLDQKKKQALVPVCLLSLAICSISFTNIQELIDFVSAYQYYVIPFTILIPIVLWLKSEWHARKAKHT